MAVIDENTPPFVVEEESGDILLVADPEQMIMETTSTAAVVTSESSLSVVEVDSGEAITATERESSVVEAVDDGDIIEAACAQGPTGPQGPQGPPGIPGDNFEEVEITPGATEIVDIAFANNIEAVKWHVVGRATVDGTIRGTTIYVSWDNAWNTYRTVFTQIGGGFPRMGILTTIVPPGLGGTGTVNANLELRITNNHSQNILVYGTRLEVAAPI